MVLKLSEKIFLCFCVFVALISWATLIKYPGEWYIYVFFTIAFNALFVSGFTERKIFFDTFLGIFFWLGFWLKFSVRVAFMGGEFHAAEQIGEFSGSGAHYDHALVVSTVGVSALLLVSFIRREWFFSYASSSMQEGGRLSEIFRFYRKHRGLILICFTIFFTVIASTNVIFGIYQRGSVPRTILPFKLGGVYTWLLLFGLASFSAVIMDCEFRLTKNPYLVTVISFLESLFSNVSLLSRGMILNGGSVVLGLLENCKRRLIATRFSYKIGMIVLFFGLFLISVFGVNHLRKHFFYQDFAMPTSVSKSFLGKHLEASFSTYLHNKPQKPMLAGKRIYQHIAYEVKLYKYRAHTFVYGCVEKFAGAVIQAFLSLESLLLDRWVGIEGAMAVSSYSGRGWDLWNDAWRERYSHSGTSMYDVKILKSPFGDMPQHHFISLPGIIAFFYYPGSYLFLFVAMVVVGLIGTCIEVAVFKFCGGNIILCALMAQVVAYRYASFGYVPYQSYLLFGSIILTIILIYVTERLLLRFRKSPGFESEIVLNQVIDRHHH
ncbi:MAG: hypothetical protein ACYDHW_00105 [Syntrophorhabdaceae bacterium]